MIHVEWLEGVLRWAPGYTGPPAPYDVAATVTRMGRVVRLAGMSGKISSPFRFLRDLRKFCLSNQIDEVRYERVRDGCMIFYRVHRYGDRWITKAWREDVCDETI